MTQPALTTILVGTDGSTDSTRAVEFAASLAAQAGAAVVLVHAMTLLEHLPDVTATGDGTREGLEALLATDWSEPLRAAGVEYRTMLDDGPPLLVVPRVADAVDADLIVVATHGRGYANGLIMGSTCHGLLQVAEQPVTVVPTRRAERPSSG